MNMTDVIRLAAVVRRFRILKGWRIRWDKSGKHYGKVWPFPKYRRAWIYRWDPASAKPEPPDFLLHETLHCTLQALIAMDRRKPKELKEAEELLVQDICAVALSMGRKG